MKTSNKPSRREVGASSTDFDYEPLDSDMNEIRLLTLLPDNTLVRCSLEHVSLINPPEYVALSYCWGDPTITQEIRIDNIAVQVTTNLESALRHLRAKGYSRLWVDAICINQQDKVERSQQLLWMGSIYRRAKEVAAWTGEEEDGSDEAIHIIEQPNVLKESPRFLESFLAFLARPYWRRVWIIQELALARNTTLHCGRRHIAWTKLSSSAKSRLLAQYASNPDLVNIRNLAQFQQDAAQNKPLRFLEALRRSSRALSTDPRDKVFALLGLVYDSALYLPVPNYRQPIKDICIGMTLSAVATSSSLDIVPFLAPVTEREGTPSWCPNWFELKSSSTSRSIDYLLGTWEVSLDPDLRIKYPRYRTAGNTTPNSSISDDVLRVEGLCLGGIKGFLPTMSESHTSCPEFTTLHSATQSNPYRDDQGLLDAIETALTFAGIDTYERAILDLLYYFWTSGQEDAGKMADIGTSTAAKLFQVQGRSLMEWAEISLSSHRCESGEDTKRDWQWWLRQYEEPARQTGMKFMTTQTGYVGWAHPQVNVDDTIFILPGCTVPVILRPRNQGGFTLVGDAYVQGVMDGEIMEPTLGQMYDGEGKKVTVQGTYWMDIEIY